jgi:hypothetical protein
MMFRFLTLSFFFFLNGLSSDVAGMLPGESKLPLKMEDARRQLNRYRSELDSFRTQYGGGYALPNAKFFQFGMGNRIKFVYRNGALVNSLSGDTLLFWDVKEEIILPPDYAVYLTTKKGDQVSITEDHSGVWISDRLGRSKIAGTDCELKLPEFYENRFPLVLKVLNHEILINILDSKPLPNLFVYKKPWRRDGAMMAMCLEKTGNIQLIKNWVLSLTEPYDYNNAGEAEADNLGQTLYLLSLFTDKANPLVALILKEAQKFEVRSTGGIYIKGRSDFHETPVYQTKWLKFGLAKLGLADQYSVPEIQDDYSSLFWWDYNDTFLKGKQDAVGQGNNNKYPYLGWAKDHFHGLKRSPISNLDYPLTWEIEASQANYNGLAVIDSALVNAKCATPHTWHASEVFLYVISGGLK